MAHLTETTTVRNQPAGPIICAVRRLLVPAMLGVLLALAGCAGASPTGTPDDRQAPQPPSGNGATTVTSTPAPGQAGTDSQSHSPDARPTASPDMPMPAGGLSAEGIQYTVQEGDTLSAIALRFDTTVEALAQANNLESPDLIFPGQVLTIVPPGRVQGVAAQPQPQPPSRGPNASATQPPAGSGQGGNPQGLGSGADSNISPTTPAEVRELPAAAPAPTYTPTPAPIPTVEAQPSPPAEQVEAQAARPTPVTVNGRKYDAYNRAVIKEGQWYQYTCEFDAAWVVLKTYGFDVGLEEQVRIVGLDTSVEPYFKETKDGIVIYGGDVTRYYSGNYRKNFLARTTGQAMRKLFEHFGLKVTPVRDRPSLEAALLRGELVWIKTTVDFKPWRPATWVMPDGRSYKTVLGNDHSLVVMGFNRDGVVVRDPLGPTNTNWQRKYEYHVPWKQFMAAWGAQEYDGLAVAPPKR